MYLTETYPDGCNDERNALSREQRGIESRVHSLVGGFLILWTGGTAAPFGPLFSETALLQTDCYSQDSLLSLLSRSVSRLDVRHSYLPM